MAVQGSCSENADKSQNCSLGFVKEEISGNLFVNNYKDRDSFTQKPITPSYGAAGASLSVGNSTSAASVTAQHIPTFGNQITAAASTNLSQGAKHSVDVNAFSTHNMPKLGPHYQTHGAGVSAQIGSAGLNAAVAHTPAFKATDYSIGGRLNLHQNPTGNVHLGVGANKTVTPHYNGSWQPGVFFGVTKKF